MNPITVFIIDDHYMVIEGIRSLLKDESNIHLIGHGSNAASALSFLAQEQPEVILLDINLPGPSGIDLCKEVKRLYPEIRIIGLSTFNQHSYIDSMLKSGASGYLLKNATAEELLLAISTVQQGGVYLSEEVMQTMKTNDENQLLLTRREKEILALLAGGLTSGEIANRLYLSVLTVETHRKNLLSKFNAKNIAAMVHMANQLQLL